MSKAFIPSLPSRLNLRYGIAPSDVDVDAGATIVDRSKVKQVMQLTEKGYR